MNSLTIKMENGVEYYYDNDNGLLLEKLNASSECEEGKYNREYLKNFKYNTMNPSVRDTDITGEQLKEYFTENGLNELIFKMTDACNMRCKYCIYSEHYPDTLTYGKDYIKKDIVKKAIDEYMNNIKVQRKNLPQKKPFIAFYGGEPLMAFNVIKFAIEYVEKYYNEMGTKFTITTNGLLLEKSEICEFLKEKNVIICLSLDGYKENHDRNRLTVNNGVSYDKLMNIIRNSFRDYNNIFTLCCIDIRTDLYKLYDFYSKNDRMNGGEVPHVLRFSYIFDQNSDYYEQFSDEDRESFKRKLDQLKKKYIELAINEKKDWILDLLIGQEYIRMADRIKFNTSTNYYIAGGCCIPGEKLFVYQDGTYGICEKVCIDGIDIGNVNTGISYEKIAKQVKSMRVAQEKRCKNCNISSLCTLCYVNINSQGDLDLNNSFCKDKIRYYEDVFKDIVYIEENNPGYWERLVKKQAKKNLQYRENDIY